MQEWIYLSAEEEESRIIAQANAPIDQTGIFLAPKVKARYTGDFPLAEAERLT